MVLVDTKYRIKSKDEFSKCREETLLWGMQNGWVGANRELGIKFTVKNQRLTVSRLLIRRSGGIRRRKICNAMRCFGGRSVEWESLTLRVCQSRWWSSKISLVYFCFFACGLPRWMDGRFWERKSSRIFLTKGDLGINKKIQPTKKTRTLTKYS